MNPYEGKTPLTLSELADALQRAVMTDPERFGEAEVWADRDGYGASCAVEGVLVRLAGEEPVASLYVDGMMPPMTVREFLRRLDDIRRNFKGSGQWPVVYTDADLPLVMENNRDEDVLEVNRTVGGIGWCEDSCTVEIHLREGVLGNPSCPPLPVPLREAKTA